MKDPSKQARKKFYNGRTLNGNPIWQHDVPELIVPVWVRIIAAVVVFGVLLFCLTSCATPQPTPPTPTLSRVPATGITVEWTVPAPSVIGQTLTRETGLVSWPDGDEIVVLPVTEPTGWVGTVNGQAVTWTPMDQRFSAILPVRNHLLVRSFAR